MPVLRRLSDEPPDNNNRAGDATDRSVPPDEGLVRGRQGYATFSLAALRERISAEILAELGGQADVLEEIDEDTRRALVREAGEYVLAVEAVSLDRAEKMALFEAVARDVFGLGPLDILLADETITEVTIDGPRHCMVRRAMGALEAAPVRFDDEAHLRGILERLMRRAGGKFQEDEPSVELGVILAGRPVRLTMILPPLSPTLHVDLRLHPRSGRTLATFAASGGLNDRELALLRALAHSPHGLLVAGNAGSGKTTFLEALLAELPECRDVWLAQRAMEIRVPEGMHTLAALPPAPENPGRSFAATIATALSEGPAMLALDELRGDEAVAFWEALTAPQTPRLLVAYRASPDPVRLRSSLRWLILRGRGGAGEREADMALLTRLPFVIMTGIAAGQLRIMAISEWQLEDSGGLTLVPLLEHGRLTGTRPLAGLDLPDTFWAEP